MYRAAALAGFVVGTVAVVAGFVRLLSDREPLELVTADDVRRYYLRHELEPVARSIGSRVHEALDLPEGVTLMIDLRPHATDASLAELRAQRRALLDLGVPEDQLEPLIDPSLS